MPPYAEWIGFGDHTERWKGSWLSTAALVERIGRETQDASVAEYVVQLRAEADEMDERPGVNTPRLSAQDYLAEPLELSEGPFEDGRALRVFPDAGWAAFRSDLRDRNRDLALVFRSSPYGSISHSHASNNDFFLHVAGRCMMMPSGYYAGYGSNHHAHWIWHTKSHNCVTLSGAGQIMRSHNSVGSTDHAYEDEWLSYVRGTADASYADRAHRCRRHVIYLKDQACYMMIDEFVAAPGIVSALEWNAHSWNEFEVDEEARSFRLQRDGSKVQGRFLYHHNSFFSLSEGFDPPPSAAKASDQWRHQYHLRFTPSGLVEQANLGVVLACGHEGLDLAHVETERVGGAEIARIGHELIAVNMGGNIDVDDLVSDSLAVLRVGGVIYEIGENGIEVV